MVTEKYNISGMTCAACSSAVERVTRKLEGVSESNVNLTTGILTITYDETKITQNDVVTKVERAGFGAELHVEKNKEEKVKEEEALEQDIKKTKHRLVTNVLLAIPLLYISMGHMVPFPMPLPNILDMHHNPLNFALAQLILTTIILYNGKKFYLVGFKSLFRGHPNMDSLVAIGTGSAFLYSLVMTISIPGNENAVHNLYYESAAIVVTLVMVGKYMEGRSKGKTSEAIRKLMELAPDTAVVIRDGEQKEVPVESVALGELILIKPGSRIPLDGIVVEGSTSVDESMLTGESIPVEKEKEDEVIGGSVNYQGAITVKVTHIGADTTLAKIVKMMEDAQGKKAPISKLADTVAGYFVPTVMQVISHSESEEKLLQIAASCEQVSEHPLGAAIVNGAKDRGIELEKVVEFQSITGQGIEAIIAGKTYYIGNKKLCVEQKIDFSEYEEEALQIAGKGQTPMFVASGGKVIGIVSVADTVKETSKAAIQKIKELGIEVHMLTGDNRLTAEYIGETVGVDHVIAEVLPNDKASVVEVLQKEGKCVMMVGDGINDAPALVQADVGVAIGSGSDIALDSSDIVLMKSNLQDVYKAIRLSKATIRNIKQNLFWAFFYNACGLPLAAGALYAINGTLLNPIFAGLAMSLSSVCVVGNALRLKTTKLD